MSTIVGAEVPVLAVLVLVGVIVRLLTAGAEVVGVVLVSVAFAFARGAAVLDPPNDPGSRSAAPGSVIGRPRGLFP